MHVAIQSGADWTGLRNPPVRAWNNCLGPVLGRSWSTGKLYWNMAAMSLSDSEEEAIHPVDELILQKAARRATVDLAVVEGATDTLTATRVDGSTELSSSTELEDGEAGTPAKAAQLADDGPPSVVKTPSVHELMQRRLSGKLVTSQGPVGVVVVEAAAAPNAEVQRLLRVPRYFDSEDTLADAASSMRCFNCGEVGHAARECVNAARVKPCHLCAQFEHDGGSCPNRLCYKCGRPGHISRECPTGHMSDVSRVCLRCGSTDCPCAGKGDYFRYEGGCANQYMLTDLALCKCYVCGHLGHLCCKAPPTTPVRLSCYNCGRLGHLGEHCTDVVRPHLDAEKHNDARRQVQQMQQQQQQYYSYEQQQTVLQAENSDWSRRRDSGAPVGGTTSNAPPQQYSVQYTSSTAQQYGRQQAPFWQQQQQQQQGRAPLFGYSSAPQDRYSRCDDTAGRSTAIPYIYGSGGAQKRAWHQDEEEAFPRGHGSGDKGGARGRHRY